MRPTIKDMVLCTMIDTHTLFDLFDDCLVGFFEMSGRWWTAGCGLDKHGEMNEWNGIGVCVCVCLFITYQLAIWLLIAAVDVPVGCFVSEPVLSTTTASFPRLFLLFFCSAKFSANSQNSFICMPKRLCTNGPKQQYFSYLRMICSNQGQDNDQQIGRKFPLRHVCLLPSLNRQPADDRYDVI